MKAIKYILSILLLIPSFLFAQNVMTSSPYSMFGIGEIETGMYGGTAGMGGVSIGMRGKDLIGSDNPAGLTGIDSCRLLADISIFGKLESYNSKGTQNNTFTGNLSRIVLAGRLFPRWYAAVGLTPYSYVGYYFQSSQEIEGSPGSYATSTFSGDGGLSKVYWTNAVRLLPTLSLGVNMNYIFGNITQTESQSSMYVTDKLYGSAFSADFGIQYHRALGRQLYLTLGATYGFKQSISLKKTKTVTSDTYSSNYEKKTIKQTLPQFIGVGGSVEYKKWTYALDYNFRQYSSLTSGDPRIGFHDAHELCTGVSYYPGGFSSDSFWKRTIYKMGVDVSTPYMQVNKNSGLSWRITAGMGFPVINGRVHVSLFYDRMLLNENTLQRSLAGLAVTYTLNELFYRVKL